MLSPTPLNDTEAEASAAVICRSTTKDQGHVERGLSPETQSRRTQHAQRLKEAQANCDLNVVGERVRQMTAANITGTHVDEVREQPCAHVTAMGLPPCTGPARRSRNTSKTT